MSSGLEELASEANKLVGEATGAGARFEQACRSTAARDLRGRRKMEVDAFFDRARGTVSAAKGGLGTGDGKERQKKEALVFMARRSQEGGPLRIEVFVEMTEQKRMREMMEDKEAYALPEELFWDFAEWFKDKISTGAFDLAGGNGEHIPDLVYSEFRGASKSWMDRKGWGNLSSSLEGVP